MLLLGNLRLSLVLIVASEAEAEAVAAVYGVGATVAASPLWRRAEPRTLPAPA